MNKPPATRLLSPAPLNRSAWSLAAGVRSAIAVCIPLVLAEWFQQPGLSWAAIVALWICLVDPGGPTMTRIRLLSWFALFSVVECGLGALVRPHLWLSVVVALLWCTATCLVRVWGTSAANAGTLLAINLLIVLGLDQPSGLSAALSFSLWSLAGAIWAMLIVLVLWRQRPYGPARTAIADVFGVSWPLRESPAGSACRRHRQPLRPPPARQPGRNRIRSVRADHHAARSLGPEFSGAGIWCSCSLTPSASFRSCSPSTNCSPIPTTDLFLRPP